MQIPNFTAALLLVLTAHNAGGKSPVSIVLGSGETITADLDWMDEMNANLLGGRAPIPRLRIASIRFVQAGPCDMRPPGLDDWVVLRDGRRSAGHVSYVSDEVHQSRATWSRRDVACILLAPRRPGAWTLNINITGGYACGAPRGAFASTQGYGSVADLVNAQQSTNGEWMQKVEQAIRAAEPSRWKSSYLPAGDNGCCDRFQYSLELQVSKPDGAWLIVSTSWFDGNEPRLPADLLRVYKIAMTNPISFGPTQPAPPDAVKR